MTLTSEMYRGTSAEARPMPMPQKTRPITMAVRLLAVPDTSAPTCTQHSVSQGTTGLLQHCCCGCDIVKALLQASPTLTAGSNGTPGSYDRSADTAEFLGSLSPCLAFGE